MAGNNQLERGERSESITVQGMLPENTQRNNPWYLPCSAAPGVPQMENRGKSFSIGWDLGQLLVKWERGNAGAGCQKCFGHQVITISHL